MGKVAYKLTLLATTRIHSTFHVSQLKKHVSIAVVSSFLPATHADGSLLKEPVQVLDRRMIQKVNVATTEVLVE